jgi:hypothetical protein
LKQPVSRVEDVLSFLVGLAHGVFSLLTGRRVHRVRIRLMCAKKFENSNKSYRTVLY